MNNKIETDILLIGAGIMSTTLASLIVKFGTCNNRIMISERLCESGLESSNTLNNAGTGHAGYCELNYSPLKDGKIDITRAIKVNKAFKKSLRFWDLLIKDSNISNDFKTKIPHISFVTGNEDISFLKQRYETLNNDKHFKGTIEFSDNPEVIKQWIPLIMENRENTLVAATKVNDGYEVDFGKLSRNLSRYLEINKVKINYYEEVIDIYKEGIKWHVVQRNVITGYETTIVTKYLFIGAGGASIDLLTKTDIPEIKGYIGFPISGEWLICKNQEIVKQHEGKVYGKTNASNPPMTAPHLDTRVISGKRCLLFGPYAIGTTKLLKHGSWTGFFKGVHFSNLKNFIIAGLKNSLLIKYLLKEVFKNKKDKFNDLLKFYPNANINDWELITAGQRVQTIKNKNGKTVIEFDTELLISKDSTIAGLLGASPGASTSVDIMLDLLDKSFGGEQIKLPKKNKKNGDKKMG